MIIFHCASGNDVILYKDSGDMKGIFDAYFCQFYVKTKVYGTHSKSLAEGLQMNILNFSFRGQVSQFLLWRNKQNYFSIIN